MKIGLLMDAADNTAVVCSVLFKDDRISVEGREYTALEDIPAGHKIAVRDIDRGEDIIKYGKVIGRAMDDIKKGEWVHCHNVLDITEEISRKYAEKYRSME